MGKRGISAIVASVMIILITVALVAILWSVIIPLINDQLAFAEQCRASSVSISVDYSCTNVDSAGTSNPEDENLTVELTRKSDAANIVDLQFSGGNNKGTAGVYLLSAGLTGANIPGVNERRTYVFAAPGLTPYISRVRVAPVVEVRGKQRTCDPDEFVYVPWCPPQDKLLPPKDPDIPSGY